MNRRDALRLLATGCAGLGMSQWALGQARRPNIVLFLVDDMGWQDTSVPLHTERTRFNDRYRTPAMERLAREGVRFIDAHSASPVCTPTRASIMTGQNPCRHGITNWTLYPDRDTTAAHPVLLPPDWRMEGLQRDDVTLPRLLQSAGYRTIHAGKAHFGAVGTSGADPTNLGFDVNIAGHAAGGPGSYWGEKNYSAAWRGGSRVWDVPGLEEYHGTDTFLTEALTLEALEAMDEAIAEEQPFYLYMSHYAVHAPIEADDDYVGLYEGIHPTEAAYASMVQGMDASLGALMGNLDRHGIADDTIIIFMSDNGGLSAHARGGEPHTHNEPLRSGKGSSFEGGTRVPMLVKWPGVVEPYSTCGVPVISDDFFPTILSMAGVDAPEEHMATVDGRDLTPLLQGTGRIDEDRLLVWHYPHAWGASGPGIIPHVSGRRSDWKLIHTYPDGRNQLYDLGSDISETHDLAEAHPERVEEITADLHDYMIAVSARVPKWKSTGLPVPLPGDEPGIRVACIGDSLTYSAGVSDPAVESYPARLASLLGDAFNVRNFGLGGATLLDGAPPSVWQQLDAIKSFNPNACIVMLGTNDTTGPPRDAWARIDGFEDDYSRLLAELRALPGQPEIWLCEPTPMEPDMPGLTDERRANLRERAPRLRELRIRIRELAEAEGTRRLDLRSPLAGRHELLTDGVHLTAEGYSLVAQTVAAGMEPWIEEHQLRGLPPRREDASGDFDAVSGGKVWQADPGYLLEAPSQSGAFALRRLAEPAEDDVTFRVSLRTQATAPEWQNGFLVFGDAGDPHTLVVAGVFLGGGTLTILAPGPDGEVRADAPLPGDALGPMELVVTYQPEPGRVTLDCRGERVMLDLPRRLGPITHRGLHCRQTRTQFWGW
ncbi:MAG: sulfatase-like hydrolase/transferase [Armatimonadia bacterium]|nr:sulfatase-like hydrolase/transferase [Armatimonadia bacterium]